MRSTRSGSWKTRQGAGLFLIACSILRPLLEQECEIAHEIARALAFADGANDDADAFGNFELTQDFAQPFAFLRIFDLARNAAAVADTA